MIRVMGLLAALTLGACGIDGAPVPPPPAEDETGRAAADGGGTRVTVGVSGSIGGVMRR